MRRVAALLGLVLLGAGSSQASRGFEVNGIRLEAAQVDRLASDIARETVAAVRRIEGLALDEAQGERLEGIYREVALGVYDAAVQVVGRADLDDAEKERRVKDLVLEGQQRSTVQVSRVLDPAQYALYRVWEERQVEAFRRRGLWSSGRRRR